MNFGIAVDNCFLCVYVNVLPEISMECSNDIEATGAYSLHVISKLNSCRNSNEIKSAEVLQIFCCYMKTHMQALYTLLYNKSNTIKSYTFK